MIHRPDRDRSSLKGQYGRQASSEAKPHSSSSSGASFSPAQEESYPQILPSDRQRSTLVKRKGKTDPSYGLPPELRSLKQHISLGSINLDKTSGPFSASRFISLTEMFFSAAILRKRLPELTQRSFSSAERERARVDVPVPGAPLMVMIILAHAPYIQGLSDDLRYGQRADEIPIEPIEYWS